MEKITILNPHRNPFEVEVIRYFVMSDAEILLYTLNEEDNENNVRLYVTKIKNGQTYDLSDQEWTYVKATIRNIVNENRNKKPLTVKDLDIDRISGLVVEHLKVFKLAKDVLPDLAANNKAEHHQPEPQPAFHQESNLFDEINSGRPSYQEEVNNTYQRPTDYKAMYEEAMKEKKKLEDELFDLQSRTVSYQIKYDQIRQILEGEKLPKDN